MYDYGLLNPVWAGTQSAEATSDTAFGQAMLDVEAAWSRAQIRFGTAPESIGAVVDAACDIQAYDLTELARKTPDGANALIPLLAELRAKVSAQDPQAASYVHRGATSQDIIDTALMLIAARTGGAIVTDIKTTVRHEDCFLSGYLLENYLHDMDIAVAYASESRRRMGEVILERLGITAADSFATIHNYVDTKARILR